MNEQPSITDVRAVTFEELNDVSLFLAAAAWKANNPTVRLIDVAVGGTDDEPFLVLYVEDCVVPAVQNVD